MGVWEFKWHVMVPERPSKGQVRKSKRLSCQSLQNDVLHYLVSGEWQEPMQVTFHIRSDTFLLDSEASVLFWVQCLPHGCLCYCKFGLWTTRTSVVSSDSTPDPLRQILHFVRFQVIYKHAHVWETLVHDMNISFSITWTTLLDTSFLLEARKKKPTKQKKQLGGEEWKRGII